MLLFQFIMGSHSRDIIGASKFKVGHVTLTMPPLRVTCNSSYAGT